MQRCQFYNSPTLYRSLYQQNTCFRSPSNMFVAKSGGIWQHKLAISVKLTFQWVNKLRPVSRYFLILIYFYIFLISFSNNSIYFDCKCRLILPGFVTMPTLLARSSTIAQPFSTASAEAGPSDWLRHLEELQNGRRSPFRFFTAGFFMTPRRV